MTRYGFWKNYCITPPVLSFPLGNKTNFQVRVVHHLPELIQLLALIAAAHDLQQPTESEELNDVRIVLVVPQVTLDGIRQIQYPQQFRDLGPILPRQLPQSPYGIDGIVLPHPDIVVGLIQRELFQTLKVGLVPFPFPFPDRLQVRQVLGTDAEMESLLIANGHGVVGILEPESAGSDAGKLAGTPNVPAHFRGRNAGRRARGQRKTPRRLWFGLSPVRLGVTYGVPNGTPVESHKYRLHS